MSISKTTIAAGVLGGGSGITGTTLLVKYVASKSESDQNQNSQTEKTGAAKTKQDIESWASTNGGCTIQAKLSGDSFQSLNSITNDSNKGDLDSLLSKLRESGSSQCKSGKALNAAKTTGNDSTIQWSFTEGDINAG